MAENLVRFTLRDYQPEDFTKLWEIDQACFAPGIAYSQFELRSYIRRRNAFTLVGEVSEPRQENAQISGFLVAESGRRAAHIITIDVLPAARKQGLGSLLLTEAETRMRNSGCLVARLETAVDNLGAIAFYKRQRYSVVGSIPRYYSSGVDALLLEKDLLSQAPSR